MGKDVNRLSGDIACIDTAKTPAMLVSTRGYHCEVWHVATTVMRSGTPVSLDLIVKKHLRPCTPREVALLQRDYNELRRRLGDVVPAARFVSTRIDGQYNVLALARAVTPWFNMANPGTQEEAIPLLRKLSRAREDLGKFVRAAEYWRDECGKVIDLWGLDNLVLDQEHRVRYIDSFQVFFYEDMLHIIEEPGYDVRSRIDVSISRLEYLRHVLREVNRVAL